MAKFGPSDANREAQFGASVALGPLVGVLLGYRFRRSGE